MLRPNKAAADHRTLQGFFVGCHLKSSDDGAIKKEGRNICVSGATSLLSPLILLFCSIGRQKTSAMSSRSIRLAPGQALHLCSLRPGSNLAVSVSVAAYKSLMEACALERRSYELSTGSLILTHSTLYCMPHTCADTRHTVR